MARAWKHSTAPSPPAPCNASTAPCRDQPLREALITRDRKQIFRVDDGIPVLLAEEAINPSQIADFPEK